MDSSRFDSIARSLGRGLSRREVLKVAFGFGSAALVGTKLAPETEAARRPTPTPKPIVCPYPKVLSGGQCVCPIGTDACGPDCCPPDAECCDNACCFGACYGEELCCPSGSFVCDDQCRPFFEGACCVDSNCDSNQICSDGVCTNVCIPTDSTGCESNGECCSGICQGGQCVATVGGTCSAGYDTCSGSGGFEACGNDSGCKCAASLAGEVVCAGDWICVGSCLECETAGGYCAAAGACCDTGNTCYFRCGPDGGNICFTADTRIALADGVSRAISEIVVGDLVLGGDGQINRVTGIDTPALGDRLLYGFNGGQAFVTASHPFMTDDGWKAVDPSNSYRDHLLPAVGRIAIGDRLVQLTGVLAAATAARGVGTFAPEIRTDPLQIESVSSSPSDPTTPVYNLRLDGNHTYFANDLLVHNK